jgi:hypothetical protein
MNSCPGDGIDRAQATSRQPNTFPFDARTAAIASSYRKLSV